MLSVRLPVPAGLSGHPFAPRVDMPDPRGGPSSTSLPALERAWRGWGFSSVEERLSGKCKALSSVPRTENRKKKKRKK
jgi:hypothetical protein